MFYESPTGVSVHGGFPNAATDSSLQSIDLNKLLVKNSISTYFMRIAGNQWQALGIFAGDLVIVDKAIQADSVDLVIWWDHDGFAISRQRKVAQDATVWGVVTAVIHQYRSRP